MRKSVIILLCLLALVAGLGVWRWSADSRLPKNSTASNAANAAAAAAKNSAATSATASVHPSVLNTNRLAFRLSNTKKTLGQLESDGHAILLQNALIDTAAALTLNLPPHLKAKGDPGAYIVQARGAIDARFRAVLAVAGAQVVSYIPNNAYLVRISAAGAGGLAGNALVQAVLPFEPYYKLQPSLLGLAVAQSPLPPGTALNVGLFAADAPAAESQIEALGGKVMATDRSPFGPVLHVLAPADWTSLAQVPGVQVLEVSRQRVLANDLSRVTVGETPDTISGITNNWLGLTGKHVLVAVDDSGVDQTHPDFSASGTAAGGPSGTTRVIGFTANDVVDTDGHGTHVAGIIAGNGSASLGINVPLTPAPNVGSFAEGSVSNADFRGKAPLANLFSINYGNSDQTLQEAAALTNAPISNNSWVYAGDYDYDLAAASYDAATRDALPGITGSQPVLFVFAAGDNGGGDDNGGGGAEDTIQSPATAKNVITVGALEQLRHITNIVTTVTDGTITNMGTPWFNETDSSNQVAGYSARGNVGVGTEGTYGRFKPDVVTPGTFVVSTRSGQWNTNAYFNPTNVTVIPYPSQFVTTNALNYYNVTVPVNAVGVTITIISNAQSQPFPTNMLIYAQQSGYPDPVNAPGSIDYTTSNNVMSIPPGGRNVVFPTIANNGFDFAVGDSTNVPVNYDMTVAIYTTNDVVSDYYSVLFGMDNQLGPYYRYETGTSMAAAEASGVLALIDGYFTNTLSLTPSPALLKAMLINGSRSEGGYLFAVTNGVNSEGWGLINITNSLPLTNNAAVPVGPNPALNSPLFFVDQSPTNALATGDSHTYLVNIDTNDLANEFQLQATLVWTDPPGDPAAAIKLVNSLTLVITNLATGDVFYGNDVSATGYNLPWNTNGAPNVDTINNVQNILLPPLLAGSYSVTVVGRSVNVNAVSAQTNNVVQDYALVVSVGEGEVPTAITSVTDNGIVSNPTGYQDITYVGTTNMPYLNQLVGANTPLLGTNTLPLGTNTGWGSDGQLTVGMTNQWHFYVVTNNGEMVNGSVVAAPNAAFITFDAYDLSIPRTGVYADSVADATRPQADIDLYVSTDPSLTNLNPVAISNCLAGTVNGTATGSGASLSQGGTEFVYFTNSLPGQVYYVGVNSEDQMASEFGFLPVFSSTPFSQVNPNGDLVVNGLNLPALIPDGDAAKPGVVTVFALAIPLIPNMQVDRVIVTNLNEHQNFGDLFGALTFGATSVVLNSHDGLGNTFPPNATPLVYDDSPNPVPGSTNTDGPGSLMSYQGQSPLGPWILTEQDNSPGFTGQVQQLTLLIQPHRKLTGGGIIATIPPLGWFIDYVDVPAGYTNLTFAATNLPPTIQPLPLQMYEEFGAEPTLNAYDQEADLTNCITGNYPTGLDPGNTISVGPPLNVGRYFIGIYNPSSSQTATVFLGATLGLGSTVNDTYNYANTNGTQLLLNDAVTSGSGVFVTATQTIASVNVGMVVTAPQISDYTFTLISPTGQRVLLMENRGGSDTNGAGSLLLYTNIINSTAAGGAAANTNYLTVSPLGETVRITYNFYTVPDEMTIYAGTNPATFTGPYANPALPYDTGFTNNPNGQNTTIYVTVPPGYTNITIIMNEFGNPYVGTGGDAWIYTAGATITNYEYLEFTDDTNLANVPIKYAIPPYSLTGQSTNYTLSDFDLATNGDYHGLTNIFDAFGGWTVPTNLVTVTTVLNITNSQLVSVTNMVVLTNNLVSVVTDPSVALGGDNTTSNYLALAYGTITRSIPTIPGRLYNVTFWYRGPDIAGWWRGEGNASDSSDPENNGNNGTLVGRFNFPAGEVGQAFGLEDNGNNFQFAGTNTYVQIPQNASLDVGQGGGFTVEGWINPTNLAQPQPLVEWLAKVPTNAAVTNLVIKAGPYLDPATGHFYYLLGATNWMVSEQWAESLGGHLATIDSANEQNWVFDNFATYGGRNRNLWIGLTNNPATNSFGWSSGETNVTYSNWLAGEPTNTDTTRDYTFMFGGTNYPAGLWTLANNNGFVQGSPTTNTVYGVAEVNNLQTNGVQFWISATNTPGTTNAGFFSNTTITNGCLYADIVDTNFVAHELHSAPGLLTNSVFQHVALTFNTNSGVAMLYLDGTNVATTNLFMTTGTFTPFVPKTDGDVLLGRDMSRYTNNYYSGLLDEMSIYGRALSDAEILAIYNVSATATNGLTGKFDPSVTPAFGLAEAAVIFGSNSNLLFGVNKQWELNSYTFTATSNSMPLQITGLQPGILLDDFSVSESPLTNLYYLPEQTLDSLTGDSAYGNWTLQVWDNRDNAVVTNLAQLLSWQLSFVLESNSMFAAALAPETPTAGTVGSGQTVYFSVAVPSWAQFATNILVSSSQPVNLLFNPTNLPTGANPGDITLLTGSTGGIPAGVSPALTVNTNPPYAPYQAGQSYILGVQNNTAFAASVVLQVNYNITALTNDLPYTNGFTTNLTDNVRYFSYTVSSNAYEATFQLLKLNGNADLVVSKGVPLPTLTNSDYGSFNVSNLDESIYVLTNSSPVPLSAGTWYLGVIKRDSGAVNYTVLAKELDVTNSVTNSVSIIDLTNGVPYNGTATPGAALNSFYRLSLASNPALTNAPGLRFELYNLTGNGDLTLQTNLPPLAPPFFQTSQNPGRTPELILVYTNNVLTNSAANGTLTNLAADWYLGVPNNEITNINFTILAEIDTNGYFPAFPGATGVGGGAAGGGGPGTLGGHGTNGTVYHVINLNGAGPGSLRAAVTTTNCTVVFDVSGTINLASPLVITNSYLTIAGQTAPGGGITVAGNMTTLQSAHDVILRDVRFRLGAADDSLQMTNVFNLIADHVSAEWSDTALSTLNSSNVTVQWSIMADSLYLTNSPMPAGSLLRQGFGALSFNHNLYADNYSGSPQLGDNISLDFVNNVIYNWGLFPGLTGGTNDLAASPGGVTNQLNYACNYLIAGPDTATFGTNYAITNIAFFGGTTNALAANWIFQTNNFIDSDTNGILNGANTQWGMFTNQYTKFGQPFPLTAVPTDEAFLAYEKVLDFAGPDMAQRDAVDTNIVAKVRTQTGRLIAAPGAPSALNNAPEYRDTDQDGLPDFWEITFGQSPYVASSGQLTTNANFIGYSDLEEYLAWLAGPHALTVTNAPVGVDLMQLFGQTGNLSFAVTNGINGTVYLTNVLGSVTNTGPWSNSIAVFTPTNTATPYSGYASFDVYATNNDTVAYFGPVTVSVVVSAVTIATNGGPQTNFIPAGATQWYLINVPTNADLATNSLLFATLPLDLWFSTNVPPTLTNAGDVQILGNSTNGAALLGTNGSPVNTTTAYIVPGGTYYLGVQNTNATGAFYAIDVTFHLLNPYAAFAFTEPATQVTGSGAQLNGFATASGLPATAWFQWGTTLAYGSATPGVAVGANYNVVFVTNQINGLTNNLPYHYRLVVSNAMSVTYGFDQIFDQAYVAAWGADYLGQISVPAGLSNVVAIAGAYDHSLAVKNDGTAAAWGDNTFGQATVPAGLSNLVAVAGGETFSVALQNSGTVAAWGADFYPGAGETNVPAGLTNVVMISSGQYSSLALQNNGLVTAWGASLFNPTNVPAGLSNVVAVASGILHSVALRNDGTVVAWGDDGAGQTNVPTGLSGVVAIAAGGYHTVALKSDGTVVAWGYNTDGQTNVPAGLSNVVAVAAGGYNSLALKSDGTVVAWGYNSSGQTSVPVGLSNVVAIASGYLHSLALTSQSFVSTNVTVLAIPAGAPKTNSIFGNSLTYYQVSVPTNADFSTNTLIFAQNGPLNIWFSTNTPPALGTTNAALLLGGVTNGASVLSAGTVPALVTNSTYYLGVQNTNSFTVNYAIEVTFHLVTATNPPPVTNAVPISSIVYTNIGVKFGFLLTWFAPSNDLFKVQWTPALNPPVTWNTFSNIVSYNPLGLITPTNAQFNFFDDASQTGGVFDPERFYRLLLLTGSANTLTFPAPSNVVVVAGSPVTVTNKATDSNPAAVLTYSLLGAPTNAAVNSTNGVVTWTNALPNGLAARFTTLVTDNGAPAASATNTFTVFVLPFPAITNVTVTATNVVLKWTAPTNDLFQVQWTTNLAPPTVWNLFPGTNTSGSGVFSFTDTNTPVLMKFYELILLP